MSESPLLLTNDSSYQRQAALATIRPWTEKALLRGLSSNILFPTNASQVKRIEDAKSSIAQTFADIDLRTMLEVPKYEPGLIPKKERALLPGKAVRVVLRAVYAKGVSTLISPLGTLYHGSQLFYWSIKKAQGEDDSSGRVRAHVKAFFTDFTMTVCGLLGSAAIFGGYKLWLEGRYVVSLSAALFCLDIGHYAFSPENLPGVIGYEGDKAGMAKAILLRNRYGVGNAQGGMLAFNAIEDDESLRDRKGMLMGRWTKKAQELLDLIKEVDQKLKAHDRRLFIGTPPNGGFIADYLEIMEDLENVIDVEEYCRRFHEIQQEIDITRRLLRECLTVKRFSFFEEMLTRQHAGEASVPLFPFDEQYAESYYTAFASREMTDEQWAQAIKKQAEGIESSATDEACFINSNDHRIYLAFRKKIVAAVNGEKPYSNYSARALFELSSSSFSKEELKKKYKSLARILSPDKHMQHKEEFEALFKCLQFAYDELLLDTL